MAVVIIVYYLTYTIYIYSYSCCMLFDITDITVNEIDMVPKKCSLLMLIHVFHAQ